MSHVIGIDIGGTFTDGVLVDETGMVTIGKVPSSPPTFHEGFIDAIEAAGAARGMSLEETVAAADGIYHGSTIAINALVEGRGARCAMLTTRGHRDTHASMQSGKRFYEEPAEVVARVSQQLKPAPLVPRSDILEIDERIGPDGRVVVGLNEAQAIEAIEAMADGVEAVAICLLWSVREPAHELRLRELIAERSPDTFVSLSHEVVARTGEYERGVATILNSMVGPITGDYLGRLEQRLKELGYGGRLQIMSSSGGLIDADQARRFPVLTLGSGPVAGLVGSAKLGEHLAADGDTKANVIATDMGGTTFDIGIVREGEPIRKKLAFFNQFAYSIPQIDMRSVGSGGGSIIHYDEVTETLKVGPQSAGAIPGPACYRRGGEVATITDADLVLGYLSAERFAGGNMDLDIEAARQVLAKVGDPLGMGPPEVAAAAVRIVDNQMADAIRLATIQQGLDPRDFTIYAYGGAGPVHATGYAGELGIGRIVVPLSDLASGWSAFGVANSDALVNVDEALPMKNPFDAEALNAAWTRLEGEATARLVAGGIPVERIGLERYAEMRYATQVNELEVRLPDGTYDATTDATIREQFDREYERVFGEGSGFAAAGYAITSVSVRARASVSRHELGERSNRSGDKAEPFESRQVIWYQADAGAVDTPIYDGEGLPAEAEIEGPAIVEFPDTALVVTPGATLTFDKMEDAVITL